MVVFVSGAEVVRFCGAVSSETCDSFRMTPEAVTDSVDASSFDEGSATVLFECIPDLSLDEAVAALMDAAFERNESNEAIVDRISSRTDFSVEVFCRLI